MKHLFIGVLILICSLSAKISVNLPINEISVQNTRGYAKFTAHELFGEPGQPLLPVYTYAVLLPPDADLKTVSVTVAGLNEEVAGEFLVKPASPPYSINGPDWPENRTIVDGKDVAAYAQNGLFPDKLVNVVSKGRLFCYKIVQVQVNLARYNPASKKLMLLKSGELVLDYTKEAGYSMSKNRPVLVPTSTNKRVKSLAVNYDEFANDYTAAFTIAKASKMVIITTSAIQSASKKLSDFVTSKERRGIDAEIVTESAWGGSASSLRSWLKSNYQTMGIEYVLLLGHYKDDVPMMNFPKYVDTSSCPSDWPYAQLDGDFTDDKTCEVHYGRIPVYDNDISNLDAILEKTIAFESTGSADIAWRKNALLLGPGYNSGDNRACVPLNAAHDAFIATTPGWTSYRMYGDRWGSPSGDYDEDVGSGTSAILAIVEKWKAGPFGVIDWATHGAPTFAEDILRYSNTPALKNNFPGFVLCGSCSNAEPSTSNNLTYTLIKNCAMGAIGGTDLTYYGSDYKTSGSDNAWAYHFARCLIADSMTAGEALTALREMAPGSFGWRNRAPYVLYGDPTIGVYTCNNSSDISDSHKPARTGFNMCLYKSRVQYFVPVSGNSAHVSIKLYSIQGKLIRTLVDGVQGPGTHVVNMNISLASGVYMVKMEAGGFCKVLNSMLTN